jgi:hypothetical protein
MWGRPGPRQGTRLPTWLDKAPASGIDDPERFVRRLREDAATAQAGLTLRHGNGQTEGQVNRLKLVKRQGNAQANVDPLRQRVVQAARQTVATPRHPGGTHSPITRRAGEPACRVEA